MIATLDLAGVKPLKPFLALCIECGAEEMVSLDEIPRCNCGARHWGVAGCAHCRALAQDSERDK